MIAQNEQKKMLIESMKKLTSHVSGNPQRQREIFEALSLQDFNKIIANLRDENEYLRRISALLLCELFYRNDRTKAGLASLLGLHPKWGRICLGSIPESIAKYPSTLKKCVQLMRGQMQEDEADRICWVINLERKTLKIQFLDYKKYSSFTFVDPSKNIFGVSIPDPSKNKQEILERSMQITSQPVEASESARRKTSQEHRQKRETNSVEYYKQFIKDRQKQRQSLANGHLNLTLDLHQPKKLNIGSPSPQHRNQPSIARKDLNVSLEIKPTSAEIRFKADSNRPKFAYQGSPKVLLSTNQQNLQLKYGHGHNNSYHAQIGGDRLKSSRFGNGGINSTRQGFEREQERIYKRIQDATKK